MPTNRDDIIQFILSTVKTGKIYYTRAELTHDVGDQFKEEDSHDIAQLIDELIETNFLIANRNRTPGKVKEQYDYIKLGKEGVKALNYDNGYYDYTDFLIEALHIDDSLKKEQLTALRKNNKWFSTQAWVGLIGGIVGLVSLLLNIYVINQNENNHSGNTIKMSSSATDTLCVEVKQ